MDIGYWALWAGIMASSLFGFLRLPAIWIGRWLATFVGSMVGSFLGALILWGAITVAWEEFIGYVPMTVYIGAGILHFALPDPLPESSSEAGADWIIGAFPIVYGGGMIFDLWEANVFWAWF